MSFAENIVKDNVYENVLIPLKVEMFFHKDEWDSADTDSSPYVFKKQIPPGFIPINFRYPNLSSAGIDSDEYENDGSQVFHWTQASSGTPYSGQWKWDQSENKIIVATPTSSSHGSAGSLPDPYGATSKVDNHIFPVYVIELIYPVSSKPLQWYLTPDDQSTEVVQWKPILLSDVTIKSSLKDRIYGASPKFSTSFKIENANGFLYELLESSKFASVNSSIYRMSGDPSIGNVQKIGQIKLGDLNKKGESISIQAKQSDLDFEMTFGIDKYEQLNVFTGIGINYSFDQRRPNQKPPTIFGHVPGIRCHCYDYAPFGASTSDNRGWFVGYNIGETDTAFNSRSLCPINAGGLELGPSENLYTGFGEHLMWRVGDRVRLTDQTLTSYEYRLIKEVQLSPPKLVLDTATTFTGFARVEKTRCSRVFINQGSTNTELMPFRDYTTSIVDGMLTVNLTSLAESNVGVSTMNNGFSVDNDDHVIAYAYGPQYQEEIVAIGNTYIKPHINLPAVAHPAAVIYLILTEAGGVAESEIDIDSFETLLQFEPSLQSPVSFIDPISTDGNRLTVIEAALGVARSHDLLLFRDVYNKWKVLKASVGSGQSWTVREKDIIDGHIDYSQDYSRTAKSCTVQFGYNGSPAIDGESRGYRSEIADGIFRGLYESTSNMSITSYAVPYELSNDDASPVHSVGDTGPARVAQQFANLASAQRNIYRMKLRKRFMLIDYGDEVTIVAERLPGFPYDKGTERSVTCNVLAITRGTNYVEVELEDKRMSKIAGDYTYSYI